MIIKFDIHCIYLGYTRYIPPLGIYMVYTWYIPTIYLVGVPDEALNALSDLQTQCVPYVVFTRQRSEALKYMRLPLGI